MSEKPNFLIIMSDQHHAGFMGCAGNAIVDTPALDALASRGVMFTNAYCAAPLCVPSRMAFMTGQYPSDIRVWSNNCILNSNIPTFAHALGADGYETVLCGRMHFCGEDQRHGFEKRLVGDITPVILGGKHSETDGLGGTTGQSRRAAEMSGPGSTWVQAYDTDVTQAAVAQIQNHDGQRPLCMVIGTYLPHCPFIAPEELYRKYKAIADMPDIPDGYFDTLHPLMRQWMADRNITDLEPEVTRRVRIAYYAMVEYFDSCVGRIIDALDNSALADNTVIVYVSDHGECAGEHGMFCKSNFFEGSAHVPMIIAGGENMQSGISIDRIVNITDLSATLLDLAGSEPMPWTRSRSLRSFLETGNHPQWNNMTLSEHYGTRSLPPGRMIRKDEWKLIYYHECEQVMLFNLEDDPSELHDLGQDEQYKDIRDSLLAEVLKDWDGADIDRSTDMIMEVYTPLLREWAQTVEPDQPDHWESPAGCNQFTIPG